MASGEASKGGGGGSLMEPLIPILAATVIGAGGGGFLGYAVLSQPPAPQAPPAEAAAKAEAHDNKHGKDEKHAADAAHHAEPAAQLQVKELPPIVTNLPGSSKSWVRLQAAVVYDPAGLPHADALVAELMSDFTAFISTLDLQAIEGPDGLLRLQEELNERAVIRSEKHVRELIIETLVVQ